MQIGDLVQNKVVIMSDDRAGGLEDSTPIIPVGTVGKVVGKSADSLTYGAKLKPGCEDSLVVEFEVSDGVRWRYDVAPEEVILCEEQTVGGC